MRGKVKVCRLVKAAHPEAACRDIPHNIIKLPSMHFSHQQQKLAVTRWRGTRKRSSTCLISCTTSPFSGHQGRAKAHNLLDIHASSVAHTTLRTSDIPTDGSCQAPQTPRDPGPRPSSKEPSLRRGPWNPRRALRLSATHPARSGPQAGRFSRSLDTNPRGRMPNQACNNKDGRPPWEA